MIGVFVSNEDRVQRFRREADGGKAFEGFLAAEAGIDEETGSLAGDQGAVAGA
jgi:hypothetical protein